MTTDHTADSIAGRIAARRALLEADTAHLDDADLRTLLLMALADSPHLHAEFTLLCDAGEATRAVTLEILATRQVVRRLRLEWALPAECHA